MYSGCMSECSKLYPPLLQDEPIRFVADDRYGRGEYVRNLALGLRRSTGPCPLVVGIQGPWGSGKTSLKNMLVEQLVAAPSDKVKGQKQEQEKVIVVEFEPWMYSGSGRLVSLLFRQISYTISGWQGIVKRHIAKVSKTASDIADFMSDMDVASLQAANKTIAKGFKEVAEVLDPSSKDVESLSKQRRKLQKKLNKSATRIIVFIDDLDRLMDDEVTDVMRAVKAVGDLPYMTYVLLYDRDSVTRSLDKSCHGKGDEYLEKIVQVPIGLPEPVKEVVLDRLKDELHNIVGEQDTPRSYGGSSDSSSRMRTIYESCVIPFVNNMRDVNRLINEFSLRYQVLKDDVETEDLLGITSLEVFNPDLHEWIMASKNQLCNPGYLEQFGHDLYNSMESNNELEEYMGSMPSSNTRVRERNLQAVESLFPRVGYAVEKVGVAEDRLFSRLWGYRSIFKAEHFDAYFRLSIGNGLLHEDIYKKLLIDDPLDETAFNHEHWYIVSDEYFAGKAGKYAELLGAERCAKIMKYCLDLEAKFYEGQVVTKCISLDVALSLMRVESTDDYIEAILNTIANSNSPVSMWVAAVLVVEMQDKPFPKHYLTGNDTAGNKNNIDWLAQSVSRKFTFEAGAKAQIWKNSFKALSNKLKHQEFKLPSKPLSGPFMLAYAEIIPIIFDDDDDKYIAFKVFHQLVTNNIFVEYVLEALTQESESGYVWVSPLLKYLLTPELCRSFIDSWKENPDSCNARDIAAYELASGSGGLDGSGSESVLVPADKVNGLIHQWMGSKAE